MSKKVVSSKKKLFGSKKSIIIFCACATVLVLICVGLGFWLFGSGEDEAIDPSQFNIFQLTYDSIPSDHDFKVVDEDGNTILSNADVKLVVSAFEESKGRYLELRLTESGATKFNEAAEDSDEVFSIMLNGKKIATNVIPDNAEDDSAIVLGSKDEVMYWFNTIT